MTDLSAINSSLTGIKRSFESAQSNASKIANKETFESDNPTDVAEPLVNLIIDRLQAEVSTKVLETSDKMIGSIINKKA